MRIYSALIILLIQVKMASLTCPIENYCQNGGTCDLIDDLLVCKCLPGIIGRQCEINNNVVVKEACPIQGFCQNEGNCSVTDGLLTCQCPSGVYGRQCEVIFLEN